MWLLEKTSPPPFYRRQLSQQHRNELDKAFIGERSQAYYLRHFQRYDLAQRLLPDWHWAAFFITLPWLLYRKRYIDAVVYAVAGWSFIHLAITFALLFNEYLILPFVDERWTWWLRGGITLAVWLGFSAWIARWANAYYYRIARREIADVVDEGLAPFAAEEVLGREGRTSLFGMGLAFALFGILLFMIMTVYLPLYARQQEQQTLFQTYDMLQAAQGRVQAIVGQTGRCPSGLPLSTAEQDVFPAHLEVLATMEGLPAESHCVIRATVTGSHWPNQHLNGTYMALYQSPDQHWHCVSSLSHRDQPRPCGE